MPIDRNLGLYKHGNLPHLDVADAFQFITFNLADAFPREQMYRNALGQGVRSGYAFAMRERQLDRGKGKCILARHDLAEIVRVSIYKLDQISHQTIAWVVMPNHVHLLLKQLKGHPLARTVKQIKGSATHGIRKAIGGSEPVWQGGYFDRMIRSVPHLLRAMEYIHLNPVRAGLVRSADNWRMSSFRNFDMRVLAEILSLPLDRLEAPIVDENPGPSSSRR